MKPVALISMVVIALFFSSGLSGQERIKFGTSSRTAPNQYLPVLVAQEKGIWKKNGLEGEWFPFNGGGPFMQAMAAKEIKAGYSATPTIFPAASRGLPIIIVSDHYQTSFSYWVGPESPLRTPKDLKGTKVGIHSLAGTGWAMARIAARALGLEKDIRFVGLGTLSARLAALKMKRVDAIVVDTDSVVELVAKGELKELLGINSYLPKDWVSNTLVTRRDTVKEEGELVGRVVRSSLEAISLIKASEPWAREKLQATSGFSKEASKLVYEGLTAGFTKDGRINRQALENVKNFLMEYGLLPRDKSPAGEEIYTPVFHQ